MSDFKLIIFDLNKTLIGNNDGAARLTDPNGWHVLPFVYKALSDLVEKKVKLAVVTNQGDVSRGKLNIGVLYKIIGDVSAVLDHPFDRIYFSPYSSSENTKTFPGFPARKPSTNMIDLVMEGFDISKDKTLFVGDGFSDKETAENAGIAFIFAHEFFMWPERYLVEDDFGITFDHEMSYGMSK